MDEDLETMVAGSVAGFGVVLRSLGAALDQVTIMQYRILVLTDQHGPMRSGDLGDELGILPSGITRMVARLVRDGYATKRVAPENRREVLVEPTERGRGLVAEVLRRRRAEFAEVLGAVSAEERAVLVRAAELLAGRVRHRPEPGLR